MSGLKLRRGTNAERLLITPADGELIYSTDTKTVFIGDGITVGGITVGVPANVTFTTANVNVLTANTINVTDLNMSGNIIPIIDSVYNIGSSSYRFKDLFLSGNTINLGGSTFSTNSNSGVIGIVPNSTMSNPNPIALIVTSNGNIFTSNTTGGVIDYDYVESLLNTGINLVPGETLDLKIEVENVNNTSATSNTISSVGKIQFNVDDGLNVVPSGNTSQVRLNQPLKTTSNVTFNTVQHSGLVMTQGTNIDQYYETSVSLQITDSWQDTAIKSTSLPTGTYVVQVFANDNLVGGEHYNEYYSGLMSWFSSDTDSTIFDEIVLHRAGRGPGSGVLFLRVQRTETSDSDDLKLQISGTINTSGAVLYTFKFRRLL